MQAGSLVDMLMNPQVVRQHGHADVMVLALALTAADLEGFCIGMAAQLPAPFGCNNPGEPACCYPPTATQCWVPISSCHC